MSPLPAIPMVRMPNDWDYRSDGSQQPGQFVINDEGTMIRFRSPMNDFINLPIHQGDGGFNGAAWKWDGNRDKPTIQPSIHVNPPQGWHGFITNGEMTTV